MAKFDVHYSFTCSKCQKPNENTITIIATDKMDAYQLAFASSICSECNEYLEQGQPFTTTIKEL